MSGLVLVLVHLLSVIQNCQTKLTTIQRETAITNKGLTITDKQCHMLVGLGVRHCIKIISVNMMQPYLLSVLPKTGWDSCQCCALTQASMLTILIVIITLLCVHLSHLSCLHLRQHGTCYWHALSGLLLVV